MISNIYEYAQDKLPFKVYGAILFKIRTRLDMNQKNFSNLLGISSVVYNKNEMSLSRGSVEYQKPPVLFYEKFCKWFYQLDVEFQNEITAMITTLFSVEERYNPECTPATRYTAYVYQKSSDYKFSTQEYWIKTSCPLDISLIDELTAFLSSRGVPNLIFQPV